MLAQAKPESHMATTQPFDLPEPDFEFVSPKASVVRVACDLTDAVTPLWG